MIVISFIIGLFLGVALVFAKNWWIHHRPAEDAGEDRYYGHLWQPVASLRKKLPKSLSGHAWEIKVAFDERGHRLMTLSMVDVASNANVTSKSVDLTSRSYDRPWAAAYREYSFIVDDLFQNEIVGPLIDWATIESHKRRSGEVVEYYMEAS